MKVIKKHWKKIALILFLVLFLLYCILVNVLVSATLVPSFMRHLDAFQEITEESVDQLVHSDTIVENTKQMVSNTYDWLETVTIQEKEITSKDGYTLVAAQILQQETSHKWVITLHGYTGCKEEQYPMAMEFYEKGYNVLGPDLRCQGSSEGDFIGMGWTDREDVLHWIEVATKLFGHEHLVVHGVSMGAATTMNVSGEPMPKQLKSIHFVEDCGYMGVWDEFSYQLSEEFGLPEFPLMYSTSLLCKLIYGWSFGEATPLEQVKKCQYPMLFIHGDADDFVPTFMVQPLYEAKPGKKDLWITKGAIHARSYDAYPQEYVKRIKAFLSN